MRGIMCALLMTAVLLAACDDDDNSGNNLQQQKTTVENTVDSGQWRITYFFDTDSEETDNFTNYIFDFGESNVLTASNGSNNVVGTWSITDDDNSNDDSNSSFNDIDFNIGFTSPPDFEELSEDWEIVSISDTKIELRHESGGNGGTDLLTFERI
jgi:hypothetical protein